MKLWKQGDLVLKKATEYGAVEIWMNERVRRACANSCADFVYGFREVLDFCNVHTSWASFKDLISKMLKFVFLN